MFAYGTFDFNESNDFTTDKLINSSTDKPCVWLRTPPNPIIFGIYAFIIPTLACFGICANFINAIVFMRPKMTPSAFSYLAALSWMDCLSCLLITFTAFSRSIFFGSNFWLTFDFQWQIPLFGVTTGAANLILACVSLDRLIYLWSGLPNGAPRFCRRKVARRMIFMVILFSTSLNLPYFFIFVVNKDGTLHTTDFYHSDYYFIHNWLTFILLAVMPAIFLLIGNAVIIFAFRRWAKQRQICQKSNLKNANNNNSQRCQKRYQHQMKLTITIIIVITLYLVGELPAHLTSRKSVLNLLFGGDITKINFKAMEQYEIIFITLNAMQLSMNIIVYAVINPSFMPEFFTCLRGASDVCFRMFCLTAISNCWQRYNTCGSTKSLDRQREEHSGQDVTPCARRNSSYQHRRGALNSWGDDELSQSSSGNCIQDGVRIRDKTVIVDGFENGSYSDNANRWESLKTVWIWKRSSSLSDFSFVNFAMSKESLEKNVNMESFKHEYVFNKRHSIAL